MFFKRHYRNTDRFDREEEVDTVVEKFLKKLANSGYGQDTKSQVLSLATTKFNRELLDSKTEIIWLYRTSKDQDV